MEYRLVKELLKDICNEIRRKDDTTDLIPNRDIAKHILDIPTRVIYHDDLTSNNVNLNPNGIHEIMDGICDALRFRTRTKAPIAHADIPRFINENVLVHFNPGAIENVDLSNIEISVNNMKIAYKGHEYIENVSVSNIQISSLLLYANSSTALSAVNQASPNQSTEWGKIVKIKFSHKIISGGLASEFIMTDSMAKVFRPSAVSIGEDFMSITMEFADFNAATGACIIKYTAGTIQCEVVPLSSFEISFTPTNLIPPVVEPPIPTRAYNSELGGNA